MKDPAFLFYSKDYQIRETEWFTENTYNKNFKITPKKAGVYLIVGVKFIPFEKEIIYIGATNNLKQRKKGHEIIKQNFKKFDHIQFYFREHNKPLSLEKKLIQIVKPKINIQYND